MAYIIETICPFFLHLLFCVFDFGFHYTLNLMVCFFSQIFHIYFPMPTVSLSAIGISAVVDRIWYGQWTFVQLNFLWFNVVRGGASIYGTHPWHWYMWQGFPVVMGTLIFPFVLGAWHAKNKTLLWIIAFIVATHRYLMKEAFMMLKIKDKIDH